MKQFFYSLFLLLLLLLVSGCSSKEYYEPKIVKDDWPTGGDLDESIIDMGADGAVLDNRQILTSSGILQRELPEEYRYITHSKDWIVAAKTNGDMLLAALALENKDVMLRLSKTIATASIDGDTLAVLFADNTLALYQISTQQLIFRLQGTAPIVIDYRIARPFFLADLVIFPTLDGKIVIVNSAQKKVVKTMTVSAQKTFNNIIYFNVIGNIIVAATPNKVFSMADKERRGDYDIRDIVYDKDGVWLSTKQGELVALTPSMEEKKKIKFPFAHFLGLIATEDKIYLLEKEGYMIVVEKDMSNYHVYEVDLEDGFVFVAGKIFYVDDEFITVK